MVSAGEASGAASVGRSGPAAEAGIDDAPLLQSPSLPKAPQTFTSERLAVETLHEGYILKMQTTNKTSTTINDFEMFEIFFIFFILDCY